VFRTRSFDGDELQGRCTVDQGHFPLLTKIREKMTKQRSNDHPALVPILPTYAKGLIDAGVETQMRGLFKAVCMQATSKSVEQRFLFARYMNPDLSVGEVIALLTKVRATITIPNVLHRFQAHLFCVPRPLLCAMFSSCPLPTAHAPF